MFNVNIYFYKNVSRETVKIYQTYYKHLALQFFCKKYTFLDIFKIIYTFLLSIYKM